MHVKSIRMQGIRCFAETGKIDLSPGINIIVGKNNAGKSSLLRGVLVWQGFPFAREDVRVDASGSVYQIDLDEIPPTARLSGILPNQISPSMQFTANIMSPNFQFRVGDRSTGITNPHQLMPSTYPDNFIVPLIARRKATSYDQTINLEVQSRVTGTFSNLYAKVDRILSGHPAGEKFDEFVQRTLGIKIASNTTSHGKEVGAYFDLNHFVSLERMGDGVAETLGLIADLCLSDDKIFVIEEPETNLHPSGLKSILELIRDSAKKNQFLIATHSNIVVRELGADPSAKIFRVYREGDDFRQASKVEELVDDSASRLELLRGLGYEFADFGLHNGWLFLEESSAETIISKILIPWFAPGLLGRLRTFSARGVTNIDPSVSEFMRLVSFIHLQPVYKNHVWVRVDNDSEGILRTQNLREAFGFTEEQCSTFTEDNFENYYPSRFRTEVKGAFSGDKESRKIAKATLLNNVVSWSGANQTEAKMAWGESAAEPIRLLQIIEGRIA